MNLSEQLQEKYDRLVMQIKAYGSVMVAFSGGVDSTLLLKAAHDALGDQAAAATVCASWVPDRELKEADEFCRKENIRQFLCRVEADEIDGFTANPPDRCYICKKALFQSMKDLADREGFAVVAEGSNMDDLGDYRPGLRAIQELQIASPLRGAELTKEEIRILSREMNLPTWKKPSFACLASRFVYGEEITDKKLHMVEMAEEWMMKEGFSQFRVRVHGMMARIEILPEQFPRIMEQERRERLYHVMKELGFSYVTLDLAGYRTGSMNDSILK